MWRKGVKNWEERLKIKNTNRRKKYEENTTCKNTLNWIEKIKNISVFSVYQKLKFVFSGKHISNYNIFFGKTHLNKSGKVCIFHYTSGKVYLNLCSSGKYISN